MTKQFTQGGSVLYTPGTALRGRRILTVKRLTKTKIVLCDDSEWHISGHMWGTSTNRAGRFGSIGYASIRPVTPEEAHDLRKEFKRHQLKQAIGKLKLLNEEYPALKSCGMEDMIRMVEAEIRA